MIYSLLIEYDKETVGYSIGEPLGFDFFYDEWSSAIELQEQWKEITPYDKLDIIICARKLFKRFLKDYKALTEPRGSYISYFRSVSLSFENNGYAGMVEVGFPTTKNIKKFYSLALEKMKNEE